MSPRMKVKEMSYDYQESTIEKIGPVALKIGAMAAAAAILIPAVFALIGPFIG